MPSRAKGPELLSRLWRDNRRADTTSRVEANSPALEQVLREEAWRAEQIVNRFRTGIWFALGITALAIFASQKLLVWLPAISLVWAVACAFIGRLWLHDLRQYRTIIPLLLTTMDATVLGLGVEVSLHLGAALTPVDAARQIYSMGFGLLLILCSNVLRWSWRLSLWSTGYCTAIYLIVLRLHSALEIYNVVDALIFLCVGGVIVYSGLKLRAVLSRVQQRDAFARFLP